MERRNQDSSSDTRHFQDTTVGALSRISNDKKKSSFNAAKVQLQLESTRRAFGKSQALKKKSFNKPEEARRGPKKVFEGEYHLDRFDDNLEHYLDSLGVPSKEYGSIFRSSSLRVVIREPTFSEGSFDKRWVLTHLDKVDGKETSTSFSFELGKPYQTCENEPGHLTISTNPSENVLIHHTFIPSKGWNIENKTVFTEKGITCYVKNLNSDVITVNYYKKHLANGKSARVDS